MSPAVLNASIDGHSPTKHKTRSPAPRQLQLLDSNHAPKSCVSSPVEKSPHAQRRHSSIAYRTSPTTFQQPDSISPSTNASPSLRAQRRQSSITYITSRDVSGAVSSPPPSAFSTRRPQSYSHAPKEFRRQSSISYIPSSENSLGSPLERPGYRRGTSETGTGSEGTNGQGGDASKRQSVSSATSGASRSPLTLTEQNADLLRSIAQHESRRMELRTQLETCEADLEKLKRQWERIVHRGINPGSIPYSTSADTSGAVLGGIREGVQEVGRMLAMGLADLSSPAMPITPYTAARHATRESDSSASSAETAFTTFGFNERRASSEWGEDLSPKDDQLKSSLKNALDSSSAKVTRRRSVKGSGDLTSRSGQHGASSSTSSAIDISIRAPASPLSSSPVPPAETRASAKPEGLHVDTASPQSKRNSLVMSGLPPPSPMPGLTSLTVVGGSASVSSWAGSIGKKWGELRNGGSSKNDPRRGSSLFSDVLFSDVSQSLANAFGPVSPSPATQLGVPGAGTGTSSSGKAIPSPAPSSRSFLDDDDDDGPALNVGSVLVPDSATSLKSRSSAPRAVTPNADTDFDDDWNW